MTIGGRMGVKVAPFGTVVIEQVGDNRREERVHRTQRTVESSKARKTHSWFVVEWLAGVGARRENENRGREQCAGERVWWAGTYPSWWWPKRWDSWPLPQPSVAKSQPVGSHNATVTRAKRADASTRTDLSIFR